MEAGTIHRTKPLLEQVIPHMMQRSSRLPQGRLNDHDGAVRCEKRQELANNRSPLCRGIYRCREQFIETVRHDNEVIGPAPHNLLTKIAFEGMFQIALETAETFAGYPHPLAIGLPQPLRVPQWCGRSIGSQDRHSFCPLRAALPQPIQQG